jgi:hypothetical protein
MKKAKKYTVLNLLLLTALSFIFYGCSKEKKLLGAWKIVNIESGDSDIDRRGEEMEVFTSNLMGGLTNDSFYKLYDNHTFGAFIKGKYTQGSWEYNDDNKKLALVHTELKKKIPMIINKLDDIWLKLELEDASLFHQGLKPVMLWKKNDSFENKTVDLLSYEQNWWRVKPKHKESKDEIKKRVLGHITYVIDYFKLVIDKKQGYFQVDILETPFSFYSGGMGLPYSVEPDSRWGQTFYNKEDAEYALFLLSNALKSIGTYPNDSRWTEGYKKALTSMREFLEK